MEKKEIEGYDLFRLRDILETFYNIHSSSITLKGIYDDFGVEFVQVGARIILEKYFWKNGTPKYMREPYDWEKQVYESLKNAK